MVPKTSIITTWFNRAELASTIKHNVGIFRDALCEWEMVVVNGGGDAEWFRNSIGTKRCEFKLVDVACSPFNKSKCINIGVANASGQLLLLLDADVLIDRPFIDGMLGALDDDSFVSAKMVTQTCPEPVPGFDPEKSLLREMIRTTELVCRDGRRGSYQEYLYAHGGRDGPGITLLRREHFMRVEGLNSNLKGWGFEDYDLQLRLQFMLRLKRKLAASLTHITHEPVRHRRATNEENRQRAFENYARGNFFGTLEQDIRGSLAVADGVTMDP